MVDLATQLTDDPKNYVNDPSIELAWAMKAAESASIHMNLLMAVDTKNLKLIKQQDLVCETFRRYFPNMDVEEVDEKKLKGEFKNQWRDFCEEFKDVTDYNLGTILRINANGIYENLNTIIVPKIIYVAIEGTRNIEGINEKWKENYTKLHKSAKSLNENVL